MGVTTGLLNADKYQIITITIPSPGALAAEIATKIDEIVAAFKAKGVDVEVL